jgi:hypothetical protein
MVPGSRSGFVQSLRAELANDGIFLHLRSAALAARCDAAYLAIRSGGDVTILASYNLPEGLTLDWEARVSPIGKFKKFFVSLDQDRGLINLDSFETHGGLWRFIINCPLNFSFFGEPVTLTCVSFKAKKVFFQEDIDLIVSISELISVNLTKRFLALVDSLNQPKNKKMNETYGSTLLSQGGHANSDLSLLTIRFLVDTLIERKKILTFKDINVYTLRTWRSSIKEWQVHALKLLKSKPCKEFAEVVAQDFNRFVLSAGIHKLVDAVTNVPCGSSGPDCLSCRTASSLADIIGLPYIKVFEDLDTKGSSHPKRNILRPAMRAKGECNRKFILIDDVVTSGSHISEAFNLIKSKGGTSFPMVWIAS